MVANNFANKLWRPAETIREEITLAPGDALTDRIKHASGNGKFILQFSGESFRRTPGANYLEGGR